jgi:Xaa-Pro dipeptidase
VCRVRLPPVGMARGSRAAPRSSRIRMYPHQTERLTEALARGRVQALVATSLENVAYLTGFTPVGGTPEHTPHFGVFTSQGTALVVPASDAVGAVDERVDVEHIVCYGDIPVVFGETPAAERARIRSVIDQAASGPSDALAAAFESIGLRGGSIGVDEGRMTPAAWQRLSSRLTGFNLVSGADALAEARRVKAPYEIDCLAQALRIAEEALDVVIQTIERGATEREAATLFAGEILKRDAVPTWVIVAMGERTWIPRPRPSDRALRPADVVRFDVGAFYKGYCGSVARTAVLGEPALHVEAAYGALQAGLENAVAKSAPGATARVIAEAALGAARAAGLSSYASQFLGHGIGLASTERPRLAPDDDTAIEAGEVLCIDTAHYEIGVAGFGVRDTVLITSAGGRPMNRSRHELIVLD